MSVRYKALGDRHRTKTAVITIDRKWYTMQARGRGSGGRERGREETEKEREGERQRDTERESRVAYPHFVFVDPDLKYGFGDEMSHTQSLQ